jgi:hypothetical protein
MQFPVSRVVVVGFGAQVVQGDDSEVYDQDQPPTNSNFIDMKEAEID